MRAPCGGTASAAPAGLPLLDWEPPQAALAFEERLVRGASFAARVSRAVAVALRECGRPRREVARRMSEFLGEEVSVAMIDAYASVARSDHRISVPRLWALLHATGDRRLLELLAEPMGWAVIERRHLPLIEAEMVREREAALRRHRKALIRRARAA